MAFMTQNHLPKICAYCGSQTDSPSRDHAVPSALWPQGQRPRSPVIVPACATCHAHGDGEVTYFRNLVVMMADPQHHAAVETMVNGPVGRSADHDQKLKHELVDSVRFAWKTTETGLVVGPGCRAPFDAQRFNRSIEKIVRALFFHKSQSPLPDTHEVTVFLGNGFWDMEAFKNLETKMETYKGLGDEVFMCRCQRDKSDPAATAWLFQFYRSVGIFAWTQKRNNPPSDSRTDQEMAGGEQLTGGAQPA